MTFSSNYMTTYLQVKKKISGEVVKTGGGVMTDYG